MSVERGEWWASLRHGGMLIAPSRLTQYFPTAPEPLYNYVVEQLRRSLTRAEAANGKAVSTLLDTVLEQVIGLKDGSDCGWKAGADVDSKWSRRAITGEMVKPRRVWKGPNGAILPVFVDGEDRIGIGRGRRAAARVIEWMRGTDTKIALLTNTRQWRIISTGLDWDAWAEADTALWFEEGKPGIQIDALRALLCPRALTPPKAGEPSPLLAAIQDTRRGQAELSAELGEHVRQAVELLIQSHGTALSNLENGVTPRDIYIAATRIVMRMVVALFAEARDLLPRENPIYHGSYGLQGLREALERVGSPERLRQRACAWPRVLALFRLIYHGSHHPQLAVLRYGGGLFRPGTEIQEEQAIAHALAVFENPENAPHDEIIYRLLILLCRSRVKVRQGTGSTWVLTSVDFSDLSSEYIGILYEGLLDYELRCDKDATVFLALGDEPALPLARLEGMDDKALTNLLSKFKQKKKLAVGGDDEDAEKDGEEEAEAEESAEVGEDTDTVEDTETAEPVEGDAADVADDAHLRERERALVWASRAAIAGKLVAKPKGKAAQTSLYQDDALMQAAKFLIRRVVLPGEWFLVRWGGTRKGSGTFYTRPALTVPTAHRTLRPLAYTPPLGADGQPDENAPVAEWTPKRPEEILALKVCDPAMGSGSFLVAGLRFLTDALFASLYHHGRIRQDGDRTLALLGEPDAGKENLTTEYLPCRPDADDFERLLRARLKRHVVERCLYGVDYDSLAVELSRLSLWVETMDRALPFEFLDHKLRNGNALIGCWFDRFRDYPALAVKRKGGDEGHKGVHYAGDQWAEAIKTFGNDQVKPALAKWVSPQCALFDEVDGQKPETLHEQAVGVMEWMHALGTSDSDNEEREKLYQEFIRPADGPHTKLRAAFDAWCALWFWPADSLDAAPLPGDFSSLSDKARSLVERLRNQYRFFHWELEFPDVFARPDSGFDVTLGNPPWETQKPNSLEFFSNYDPLYRTYGKQEALDRQRELFEADPGVERAWLDYNARFKALSNWVAYGGEPFGDYIDSEGKELDSGEKFALVKTWRDRQNYALHDTWRSRRKQRMGYADRQHPYRHQGSADLNTYKMFLETAHVLLRTGGRMGLIVPSGIYTDKGATNLRLLFLNRCQWKWLFGFENRNKIFDIHGSFKFCPIIVEKGGETQEIRAAFMRRDVHDWEDAEAHALAYRRAQVERFSPQTKAILEIRTARDLAILGKIYASSVLLGATGPDAWNIKYAREFDMTNDSKLFPPRPKWEAQGFVPDEYGRWLKPEHVADAAPDEPGWIHLLNGGWVYENDIEETALPLYEGRMIGQFDFSQKGWVSGKGRTAVWRDIPFDNMVIEPQYVMGFDNFTSAVDKDGNPKAVREAKLAFMDVTAATNARTMIAAIVYEVPCGNSAPVLTSSQSPLILALVLNSFVYDYNARGRCGGLHLNCFVISETPLVQIDGVGALLQFAAQLNCINAIFASDWLRLRADAKRSGRELGKWTQLWAVTPHERLRLRCLLDAVVAELYGLDWDDLAWILRDCDHPVAQVNSKAFVRDLDPKGFWRTDKNQPPELRHTVLTLAAFADLKAVIAAHDGDQERGIAAFCAGADGEGWMLPISLCLADLGLGHDERATCPQPVREKMGARFQDWQLAQSIEESWAECERHARNLLGEAGYRALVAELHGPPMTYALVAETAAAYGDNKPVDNFELVAPDYTPQGKLSL